MKKGTARLMMSIGAIAYAALMVLQLMTQLFNVSFMSFVSLGILVQAALVLPVLGYLFTGLRIPIVEYSKWLALVIAVLAVSGNLGVVEPGRYSGPDVAYRADRQSLEEDAGALEKLELAVDLADAEDEEDKKEIRKKIKAIDDDLNAKEKKEINRKKEVLKAEKAVADFKAPGQIENVVDAANRAALIIISAMLILAGAVYEKHEDQKPV